MIEHQPHLHVRWIDSGREPESQPHPGYPFGVDIDLTKGALQSCQIALPYPARRCGYYVIECSQCGIRTMITTAGRRDDPRSARIACKLQ
jgi:hypothetical protein